MTADRGAACGTDTDTDPARVLVTGAGGIIGRRTVQWLLSQDIAVTALSNAPIAGPSPGSRSVVGNTTSETDVAAALAGCDAVVHLAALAHPSLGTPYEVYGNNVASTFNVLAQAAARGITRVVLAGSINAAGIGMNPHGPLPAYFPLDEQLPDDIADAYSLSKRVDELSAAMAARTWGTDVVTLRFPLVKSLDTLREVQRAVIVDPVSMVRTGWAYLTDTDAARAIHSSLRVPLRGAHVIGLSAADTLLPEPTESLLKSYAARVERRRPFPGNAALVDTGRAEALLGFHPRESVHPSAYTATAARGRTP
jgi:nucleoside-diphosphate-sugar epimerase